MNQLGTILNEAGLLNGEARKRALYRAKKSRDNIIGLLQKYSPKTMRHRKLRTQLDTINATIRELQ